MSVEVKSGKKVTATALLARKADPEKIVALTAYDFTFAALFDDLVDVLLIGDSLGMVIKGEPNTLGVTLEEVIYHTRAVARAAKHAHVVADMPFMSYQASTKEAVRNAGRLLSEGKAESVKLEGGTNIAKAVKKIVGYGIPVLGHIGLTPQSVHQFGGYKIQGKTEAQRLRLLEDAAALEDAGAWGIVLEGIPLDLGREITSKISIPTIGIGAGPHCDGQVLVMQDLLGLLPDFKPRFVKNYAHLAENVRTAARAYVDEVHKGRFPDESHSF